MLLLVAVDSDSALSDLQSCIHAADPIQAQPVTMVFALVDLHLLVVVLLALQRLSSRPVSGGSGSVAGFPF